MNHHKEILARFDEKFCHTDESGIKWCTNPNPEEVHTFLLESLKQERLRTLEDAERAVEERKKNRLMGEVVMITDDVANMSLRAGMEDGFDSSLTAIRNLKPKDV